MSEQKSVQDTNEHHCADGHSCAHWSSPSSGSKRERRLQPCSDCIDGSSSVRLESVQTLCWSWKMILCAHTRRSLRRRGRYRSQLQVPSLVRSGMCPLSMINAHASALTSCEGPAACTCLGTISPAKSPIGAHRVACCTGTGWLD